MLGTSMTIVYAAELVTVHPLVDEDKNVVGGQVALWRVSSLYNPDRGMFFQESSHTTRPC